MQDTPNCVLLFLVLTGPDWILILLESNGNTVLPVSYTHLDVYKRQVLLNGHPDDNVAGILNLSFTGIAAEALLTAIPEIAVATGSACTSAGNEPSHVLRAMGCDAVRALSLIHI